MCARVLLMRRRGDLFRAAASCRLVVGARKI
jgi:hypothetical protein